MTILQYEDGTVFTIKAKDVRKQIVKAPKKPRSRSRGRSPGRRAKPRTPASSPESKPKAAPKPKTPKVVVPPTPTRQSARIAAKQEVVEKPAPLKAVINAPINAVKSIVGFILGMFTFRCMQIYLCIQILFFI